MLRHAPFVAFIAMLLVTFAGNKAASSAIVNQKESMSEMSIGQVDASVTIIEFASLGCNHCAKFHNETLPRIKKEFIDTGKVRLIFQDFPLGAPALAASMIARCSGPKKFFGFIEILFRSQD